MPGSNGDAADLRRLGEGLRLTPSQRRFFDLLADGNAHRKEELVPLLWDDQSDPHTVMMHVSNLRAKLRTVGHEIMARSFQGVTFYQIFQLPPLPPV